MSASWAVVTGGSTGLGAAFADHLAAEGANVILAARSEDKLEQVAAGLRERHGVETKVVPVDLTDRAARARFVAGLEGLDISHLVNNAGSGAFGNFHELDPDVISREVELDVVALTELTRALVGGMVARGRGAIINVSSTAGFQPIPGWSVYSSAKAYVLRFSIALWEELKPTGVRAIAICPGPTETEFFVNAGNDSVMGGRRTPADVVKTTFTGLAAHRPYVIDGARNQAMAFLNRLAPTRVQAAVAKLITTN